MKIAIDGPSGAGKSTMARSCARELGFVYIDTGAMYRACALRAINAGKPNDIAGLEGMILDIRHVDGEQRIFVDGKDVSNDIRTPEISMAASNISAIGEVRSRMTELQRALAASKDVIMDGRDIGTVVLPDADVKIFLTASAEERAKRRFDELSAKGMDVPYDAILEDMEKRDAQDSSRAIAPLKPAPDAVVIDSTGCAPERVAARIVGLIKGACGL